MVEPHAALFLFGPLAAAALLLPRPPGAPAPGRVDPALALLLALLLLWAGISLFWTTAPDDGLLRWLSAIPLLALLLLSLQAAREALPSERRLVRRALVAGVLLALLVLAEEWLLDAPLYRSTVGWDVPPEDALTKMSRALSLLLLLAWTVAALPGRRAGLGWLAPAAALLFTLLFGQQAGTVALLGGALAWLLLARRPGAWRRLWPPLLLLLLLGGPLLLWGLGQVGLEQAEWLPNTARYRIQIWRVAAERLFEAPLFGWGLEASERLPDGGEVSLAGAARVVTGHPHNVLLQLWLELGLPGLLLGGGILALLFHRVRRPAAAALLVSALVLGLLSYGLWRPHSLSILATALLAYALAARPSSEAASASDSAASTR